MYIVAIIATKNRVELMKKAVNSVLGQKEKVDDFIVVSDSDEINAQKEGLFLKDVNCHYAKDIYTHNYAGNLNSALEYLIGNYFSVLNFDNTYIAFLDDDDTWDKNYILNCKKNIEDKDFLVAGIKGKNENGEYFLDIPKELTIQSFLRGNPGIQGSNTFIRLSKLLQAGCFDENMSSTTDRDLFTRVMMLKPSYVTVDSYLINVEASNDRQRITNTKNIKLDGLSKFFYKYHGLMNEETEKNFFDRAYNVFHFNKEDIINHIVLSDYSTEVTQKMSRNALKNCYIERKTLVDKVYSSLSAKDEKRISRSAIEKIKNDRFGNFNSADYLETPLFGIESNLYSNIACTGTEAEEYFKSIFEKYIQPLSQEKDYYSWLKSIVLQGFDEDNSIIESIIINAVLEVFHAYGIKENRVFYYEKYCDFARRLVARYIMNCYRIDGLSKLSDWQNTYRVEDIDTSKILRYVFSEVDIKGVFDFIRKVIEQGITKSDFESKQQYIQKNLKLKNLCVLGYGSEGCVFTDFNKIYKWFNKTDDKLFKYLLKTGELLRGFKYTYDFTPFKIDENIFISYDYSKSEEVSSVESINPIFDFIEQLKSRNLTVDNIKKDNFRLDNGKLKYIDYGFSIKEYSEEGYKKSKARAKQLIDNFDKNDLYFYKLINKYYIEQGSK